MFFKVVAVIKLTLIAHSLDQICGQYHNPNDDSEEIGWDNTDFYSFTVTDITGKEISLEKYRGKVSLVVNVASECGYTEKHYKALVKLQNELGPSGKFTVLAFPCNQFGQQEPGTNEDILQFAFKNYQANFPIFSKIDILGDYVPVAWSYLIEKANRAPNWNFWKFLVDGNGHFLGAWDQRVNVEDLENLIRDTVNQSRIKTGKRETAHVEL